MKMTWGFLQKKWRNIRLKNKFICIIVSVTLLMGGFSIFASAGMAKSYNDLLYEKSADSLASLSTQIAIDAQAVSYVSDFIATNSAVQLHLEQLKGERDILKANEKVASLRSLLSSYFSYSPYLMSITLYNEQQKTIIHVGRDNWQPEGKLLKRARETAMSLNGREGWLSTGSDKTGALCTRMIRRIRNLELDNLAHLVVRVDMASLVGSAKSKVSADTRLLLEGEEPLYPANDKEQFEEYHTRFPANGDYGIFILDGEKVFAVSRRVDSYGWECMMAIGYQDVFQSVLLARMAFILCILFLTAATILLSNRVIGSIMKHLNRLMSKMDSYAGGLEPPRESYDYSQRGDELGVLHRRFDAMAVQIKQLVEDNYVKQLLLQDTRLKALEAQINPHFLYNTLDSINWQAKRSGEKRISEMAEALGGLLRSTISEKEDTITLGRELNIVENYIKIQRIRFEDRLQFERRVDENLLDARVPKMSIQPLVENAVKYALEEVSDLCLIRLTARRREKNVEIVVWNSGSQIDEDILNKLENQQIAASGTGVGLLNIHKRIKLIYGPDYGLRFQNGEDSVSVIITIPYEIS